MEEDELYFECLHSHWAAVMFRYAGLLVGCLATGMAFCSDLFAAYGETMKEAFGFSQKELVVIMSLSHLGMMSALPTGLVVQRFDARWLSGGAFVLSVTSCALIWGSTYHAQFYKEYFYVLGLYYFLLGCAGGMMYMIALTVNLQNFAGRHSGVVSGVIHAARNVVLGVLFGLYDVLHLDLFPIQPATPVTAPANTPAPTPGNVHPKLDILRDFFTFLLIGYSSVNVLAVLFYGDYRSSEREYATSHELQPIRHVPSVSSTTTGYSSTADVRQLVPLEEGDQPNPLCELVTNRTFHFFLWPSVTLLALRNVHLTNLSVVLESFHLVDYRRVVYLIPAAGLLLKPLLGALADALEKRLPRSLFFLVSTGLLILLYLLDMGFAEILPVLVISMAVSMLTEACVQALGPGVHDNLFGRRSFPSGWGLITLLMTVFTLLFQLLFGILYDAFLPTGQIICYGFRCYIIYFFISALVTYGCAVLLFFLTRTEWEKLKNHGRTDGSSTT